MALRPAHATCLGLALLWARPVHAQAPVPAPAPPAATLAAAPVVVERREALDVNRSRCGFEIRTRFGQKIEGVFRRFEGELLRLADGRHQVRLRMDARQVEIPDKPRYTAWMRGEDFFDVEHHPLVQFDSEPYAGDITVTGSVGPHPGYTTLALQTSKGRINAAGGATLTVPNLALQAGSGIGTTGELEIDATHLAFASQSGPIHLNDASAVTLTSVDTLLGSSIPGDI